VAHCGELFLQLPGVSTTPLLVQALVGENGSSADLLFDTGREAGAWKVGLLFQPLAASAHLHGMPTSQLSTYKSPALLGWLPHHMAGPVTDAAVSII